MTPTREPERQQLAQTVQRVVDLTESAVEAALRLGVSDETIRRRIKLGQLDYIKLGRDVRIWREQP
jgi:excisionase family DNA binding protein